MSDAESSIISIGSIVCLTRQDQVQVERQIVIKFCLGHQLTSH